VGNLCILFRPHNHHKIPWMNKNAFNKGVLWKKINEKFFVK
jgi:hypothetical protein